jgi:membrane protein implicated in regulation of membrane protease activity
MSTYNAIAWLPLCAGLTGIGLVAYLTGSIEMFWKIGTAIGTFATSFVFSLKVWSGVAVAALAAVLFVVSAAGRRRKRARRGQDAVADQPGQASGAGGAVAADRNGTKGSSRKELATKPARAAKGTPDDDDDMAGVEDILRRHGIT